jgi:hypothetical protein
MMTQVHIPVSVGELVDKVTILNIKNLLISDPEKLDNIQRELQALLAILSELPLSQQIRELQCQLQLVNMELWLIEDYKRACERNQDFGDAFVNSARQVYLKNDIRASIKRQINHLTGSDIVEEKSYSSAA